MKIKSIVVLLLILMAVGCTHAPAAAPVATSATALNQYMYVVRPARVAMVTSGPTEAEMPALQGHVAYLQQLTRDGVLLLGGRTQNNDAETMGIVIFQAKSDEEAAAIMNNDPAVKAGVFTGKVYPYKIAFGRFAAAQ